MESFATVHFPVRGVDQSQSFSRQPDDTTRTGINVRAYEPGSSRARGGQRPGLSKYLPNKPGTTFIQELQLVAGSGYSPPGGSVQTSQSGRVVTLTAVVGGNVYVANAGSTLWTPANNNAGNPPLNATGVVYSAVLNQKVWFADGVHWVYYDPSNNGVWPWVASQGALPGVIGSANTPRLIEAWRGRIVVSGVIDTPQDWFMSAVGDPTNWNYAPNAFTPTEAVAGDSAPQGKVGDVVTGIIPYTDDVLVFLTDHQIWLMQGDPLYGGTLTIVTNDIGGAWGRAWAMDPYGNIYFVSNHTGIYSMVPGQQPQRISQGIEQLLVNVDTGANTIRLLWNDRWQGLHVFITPTASAAAATHFFWEQRTGAWWKDTFANNSHNPLACVKFDGNTPGDRVALIGSWDGYVRSVSGSAPDDDGTPISSQVLIGPILSKDLDDIMLKDIQGILATSSGTVTYNIYVGATAEAALNSSPITTGTWSSGRNLSSFVRQAGHAIYIGINATNSWAMESIRARIAALGKVRRRGV